MALNYSVQDVDSMTEDGPFEHAGEAFNWGDRLDANRDFRVIATLDDGRRFLLPRSVIS